VIRRACSNRVSRSVS